MRISVVLLIMLSLVGAGNGAETVERIAAVVGDRVILTSEVAGQVQLLLLQMGPTAKVDENQVAHDVLDQMISDELILLAARDDTSITASPDEIRSELDQHMASLVARFPNEQAFLDQLAREDLTKRALEKRLRPEIRDQILKQKIISKKLSQISVSRQEAERFFETYRDSLPEIPAKVKLAHILLRFKPSGKTDDSLRALAEQARQMALDGADFVDLANRFSQSSSGVVGGRIGYVHRDELVAEFGRAAFGLSPGGISGPVRTEYGWHIIKCHNRDADSADVSHVLFPASPTEADSLAIKTLADSLYRELLNGADFRELAKAHSEDDDTRAVGGELEPMTADQLRPEFVAPLENINPGEITAPLLSQLGYHILRLIERSPGRPLDIKEDYDIIRNFAQQNKTAGMVAEWVDDLKAKTYIDIRVAELK